MTEHEAIMGAVPCSIFKARDWRCREDFYRKGGGPRFLISRSWYPVYGVLRMVDDVAVSDDGRCCVVTCGLNTIVMDIEARLYQFHRGDEIDAAQSALADLYRNAATSVSEPPPTALCAIDYA